MAKKSVKATEGVGSLESKKVGGLKVPEQVMVELGGLNFAKYNPRTISPEKMAALEASLVEHGLVLNLVAQKKSDAGESLVLIGGHQRVAAMRAVCAQRGWEEPTRVPVVVLDVTDTKAKRLNVALNAIEGEFDPYKLGELFGSIRAGMEPEDVLATGFDAAQIDDLIRLTEPLEETPALSENEGEGGEEISGFGRSITLSVECATVEERDEAKQILAARARSSQTKPGEVLLSLLRSR